MIVCVESNFILELAFLREEHESCLEILDIARRKDIAIKLPAFSIGESYGALVLAHKRRKDLHSKLALEINELSRSKTHREISEGFRGLASLLIKSIEEEKRKLDETFLSLLDEAEIIATEAGVVRAAINYQETLNLSPQDSLVYASIIECVSSTPGELSCFITKDKDFSISEIMRELKDKDCILLAGENAFENGLRYIRHILSRP